MTTVFKAHFDGKVIIPDEPVDLPIDTPLIVEVRVCSSLSLTTTPDEPGDEEDVFDWLARNAIEDDDLPRDLGHQHEHYLYGTPKNPPLP